MILSASYDEISRLIREKSGRTVGFQYKSDDTLTLTYEASLSLPILNRPITHTVAADVQLVSFDGKRIVLQVDAGKAGNMALDMASQKLLQQLPPGLMESFSGGRAVLNLAAVPQLESLLSRMRIDNVSFYSSSLSFEITPL